MTTTSFSASASYARSVRARDRHGEQRAPLLDECGRRASRSSVALHPGERDVGQEAQPALVDADQRHVERRQLRARSTASCRRRPARCARSAVAGQPASSEIVSTSVACRRAAPCRRRARRDGRAQRRNADELRRAAPQAGPRVAADQRDTREAVGGRARAWRRLNHSAPRGLAVRHVRADGCRRDAGRVICLRDARRRNRRYAGSARAQHLLKTLDRALRRRRPAGRLARAVAPFRPRPVAGDAFAT